MHRYNFLKHEQVAEYVQEAKQCEARGNCDEVQEKYREISLAQQDKLIAICATDSKKCHAQYQDLIRDHDKFRAELDKLAGGEVPWRISLDTGPLLLQYTDAEGAVSQAGFAQAIKQKYGLDDEQASIVSAAALSAMGGVGFNSRIRPVNGRAPINSKYANTTIPLKDLPEKIREKYPHSIHFNGAGFPDFSRYSIKNVVIEPGRSRKVDYRRADIAAGYNSEKPRPKGYVWHHNEHVGYMQLVPSDLHEAVKHTGGIAKQK
ncbi:HNH endonuclease [Salinicola tamaricis]|uniref:HNH endonuclease n=1 Tax=Salinicola tamaricis TaxID=1771309 RepID=UPI001A925884|nr:HNH endonuclease [Salinicola tamaricis]